jgi:C-terminal processing protease CtpA/Prc
VSKTSLFDGPIAYVRVTGVADGLDKAVREAWDSLGKTNQLAGFIVDLRYAGGTDYAAAVATAELFIKKEQPLLDWGQGMVRSKDKPELKTLPLAVLVNQQTAAASEALGAILREAGAALILGSRTAGQAMISQEYPLKDGQRLRIATTPIQLGDGSSLSSEGIKPDISVDVSSADERAYYADAFKELSRAGGGPGAIVSANSGTSTNRVRRPRFNEAELVRERRDGTLSDGDQAGAGSGDADKPVVRDPVLGRALDFLKGLNVIRQTRS